MSDRKPLRCSRCNGTISAKDLDFYGLPNLLCPDCREVQRMRERRRCAGWTDAKGKHHGCPKKITDYRCPACWTRHRESYEERDMLPDCPSRELTALDEAAPTTISMYDRRFYVI